MISLNFTFIVELALFLAFYGLSRRFVFAPLYRMMQDRKARVLRDEQQAKADNAEVQRLRALQAQRLAETQRQAAQRLRDARFLEYTKNRQEFDERREKAEHEVANFRARVQRQVEMERRSYQKHLPGLVEAMDRQVNVEGSLF